MGSVKGFMQRSSGYRMASNGYFLNKTVSLDSDASSGPQLARSQILKGFYLRSNGRRT